MNNKLLNFRTDPETSKLLKGTAKALDLSMSELIRRAVNLFMEDQIKQYQSGYLKRAARVLGYKPDPETLLKNMTLPGLRTWSDPAVTDEEIFTEFVKLKVVT
jgi:hypothetical protein